MSEFRRFISYIYSYQGSLKLHNTGFVKMEARGEILRVQVHIKGIQGARNLPCRVYGFFREEHQMRGILLGEFTARNGMGDMAAVTDRNHVGNTDKCLEDLGGVYICVGQEKDFALASEWDNIAVDTADFKEYIREEKQEKIENQVAETFAKALENNNEQEELSEETMEESIEALVNAVVKGSTKEPLEKAEGKEIESAGIKESGETTDDGIPDHTEEMSQNNQPADENSQQRAFRENEQSEEASKVKAAEKVEDNPAILQEQSVICGEINLNVENFQKNEECCGNKNSWEQLLKEYTMVHPFEKCQDMEIIRIEPKDLNRLEKKYWVLANNSFLLHGYCSYRYLILGKNKKDNKFFLGVPGIFHPREKMIANMFGFNEFHMSRNAKLRQGEFGYYLRSVELEGD